MNALAVRQLRYVYPDGTVALDGVDFELREGETVALFGANGSGKTTFVLCLAGLLKPTSGSVTTSEIGLVFQDADDQLFMPTVIDDVMFGLLNRGMAAEEAERIAIATLRRVGIDDGSRRPPYHLSAGEKRRVAIAGVLAMNPRVLVLDEPTTYLDPRVQAKLYRYLSQQTFQRIGGSKPIAVKTRIIAASTADLAAKVREGGFRADLYYALNVVSIALPPLRERREDIPAMLQMYLKQFSLQYQKPLPSLSPEVMLAFAGYDWPGNILELRNVVERCVILCEDDLITMEQLPQALQALQPSLEPAPVQARDRGEAMAASSDGVETAAAAKPLKASASQSEEQRLIREALAKTAGNKSAAAKLLGVSRGTLYNKMKELGLE